MKEGDLVKFKPGVLEAPQTSYIKEVAPKLEYGAAYKVYDDRSHGACPLYIRNPKGSNRVYIAEHLVDVVNPEEAQEDSQRTVEVYSQVILNEPTIGFTLGDTLSVHSINISGSYMLNTYDGVRPVAASKVTPVLSSGTKYVLCRCPSFVSPVVKLPETNYNSEGNKKMATPIEPDVLTPENKRIIKKQKAVAAEFLNKLSVINPVAILAGGSLRNWHFNRPANDLDFFVEVPNQSTSTRLTNSLRTLGVTDIFNMATHSAPGVLRDKVGTEHQYGERMSDIHTVLEGKYQGETVQVIFTRVSTFGYIEDHFDTSINMIWASSYEYEGDYQLSVGYTQEWYATARTGVIFVFDNQNAYTNNHLEKIAGYFPEAPMAHHRYMDEIVDDPSLAEHECQSWEDILDELMEEQNERERTLDGDFF